MPSSIGSLFTLLSLVLLVVTVYALVDAAFRPAEAYRAAGKQSKPMWLIFLGLAGAWQFFGGASIGLIGLLGLVATIVYLVDVRPALRSLDGGGRPRRGGPTQQPW